MDEGWECGDAGRDRVGNRALRTMVIVMTLIPARAVLAALRRGWRTLLMVNAVFAVVGATLVAPLTAGLVQVVVSMSGKPALSDVEIADFFFSPGGALGLMGLGTVLLALQVLGYAALLIPARLLLQGGTCSFFEVLQVLLPALPRLLRLCGLFVVQLVGCTLPFLGMAAGIYRVLLSGNDINFYLVYKPPVFLWAGGLVVLVLLGYLWVVARLVSGWVHAFPLVLFRGEAPMVALRVSRRAAAGQRRALCAGLVGWGLVMPVVGSVLTLPWSSLAFWAAQHWQNQLTWLVVALGVCLAFSLVTGWVVSFAGLALLALQNMRFYLQISPEDAMPCEPSESCRLQIGMKTAGAGALGLCLVTIWMSGRWIGTLHDEHFTAVIAHRGASVSAPENSMAAVQAAIEAGADWIEIDVQESADGTVMVFHDNDFKRMGGPSRSIWQLRDAELAQIDIGSWKSAVFSGERPPRLVDVLAACRGRAGVLIELKYYGHEQRLEERVVEVVEAAGMVDHVMIMSLSHKGIKKFKSLRPQWKTGLLATVALGDLTRLDVDFLGLNARTTSRRLVEEAARRGVKVHVWTVNRPGEMVAMLGTGVDGLITDDPALARAVLAERAEASLAEKVLLDLASFLGRKPPVASQ